MLLMGVIPQLTRDIAFISQGETNEKAPDHFGPGLSQCGMSWTYALAVSLLRSTTVGVAMKMEL